MFADVLLDRFILREIGEEGFQRIEAAIQHAFQAEELFFGGGDGHERVEGGLEHIVIQTAGDAVDVILDGLALREAGGQSRQIIDG